MRYILIGMHINFKEKNKTILNEIVLNEMGGGQFVATLYILTSNCIEIKKKVIIQINYVLLLFFYRIFFKE